jgi:hypothetical protein
MRRLLGLAVVLMLAGCAWPTIDRTDMEGAMYADCVRSGGRWYGDNQFGGSCRFEGGPFP